MNWDNPADLSGIVGAYYRLDTVPTSPNDGIWKPGADLEQITGITVTGEGTHTVYVWLKDAAGNVKHTIAQTTTLRYDATPPTSVTITAPEHISATQFLVSWSAQDAASGIASYTVEYSGTAYTTWQEWWTGVTSTSATFPVPTTETDYVFRVTAYDRAGNSDWKETTTHVGPFYIYLPLIVRNYKPFANGDFEAGWAYWVHSKGSFMGNGSGLDQSIVFFEGSNRALLGNPAYRDGSIPVGYAYIAQEFSVPAGNPRLSLQYRVHSWDTVWGLTTQRYFDTFELSINRSPEQITDQERDDRGCRDPSRLNPTGLLTPSGDGLVFCGGQPPIKPPNEWDSGWRTVTLDLSAFAGRNITLYIATWSREYDQPWTDDRGYYNTYSYVDNIIVEGY